MTHPEFPSQSIAPEDQVRLAEMGAMMERTFTTPHTGKVSWERVFEATRAVGPENTVWATDLGQKANPPVEDGLALMADAFLADGFTDDGDPHDGRREHAPCRGHRAARRGARRATSEAS